MFVALYYLLKRDSCLYLGKFPRSEMIVSSDWNVYHFIVVSNSSISTSRYLVLKNSRYPFSLSSDSRHHFPANNVANYFRSQQPLPYSHIWWHSFQPSVLVTIFHNWVPLEDQQSCIRAGRLAVCYIHSTARSLAARSFQKSLLERCRKCRTN